MCTASDWCCSGAITLSDNYYGCNLGLNFVIDKNKFSTFIIIDRFYIALFPALEQTHCARM